MENSGLALFAFVAGILALGFQERRVETRTLASLLLAILFGGMLFQSRRFVEYFPPFALIFSAFAWAPLIQRWQTASQGPRSLESRLQRLLPTAILSLGLILFLTPSLRSTQASVQSAKPNQLYANAASWLEANSLPGDRVFQTDWDDFTRLFYYNSYNTYTVGLDPTYLQNFDAKLYDLWIKISQGEIANPASMIAEAFGAKFVFTDLNHGDFLRVAESDPDLVEVYRDEESAIFEVFPSGKVN